MLPGLYRRVDNDPRRSLRAYGAMSIDGVVPIVSFDKKLIFGLASILNESRLTTHFNGWLALFYISLLVGWYGKYLS